MKWHRRRIKVLDETLETERFTLQSTDKWQALKLYKRMNDDAEILLQLSHSDKKAGWLRILRKYKLPNQRSRFIHAIVPKGTAQSIGYHEIYLASYKSASMGVVILDRDWWGKAAPLEVRKAVMGHFVKHAGVERFTGSVEARNFASLLNYRKLGFNHTGTMHRCSFDSVRNTTVDYLQFELLKDDFPSYLPEAAT
ncbi:GNAT family N-acetyltransferase [Hoeflea prorocentri]|uniref:GNAT family protein n=1 Tax=Hoeflea prorocentri TaxID=1922333 RepID=A0A9X3ZJA7_9HYPH|nr:GNAT family protein [Hoeflea prorocentri]MCY6382620.1 GNAT family protein [Hoeflea prorocentri]MDA5400420.1 GNAT family protein [Hoeflea prorocentri]